MLEDEFKTILKQLVTARNILSTRDELREDSDTDVEKLLDTLLQNKELFKNSEIKEHWKLHMTMDVIPKLCNVIDILDGLVAEIVAAARHHGFDLSVFKKS